ncbi:MAG: DUF502 domain-containing protein [Chloroflexi bacterium]|nr:DUF502 domain-containing protein [Chloroflexota bacterium]
MKRRRDRRFEGEGRRGPVNRLKRGLGSHLRGSLIAGSLLLIPVALTYLILRFLFDVVDGVLSPFITWLLAQVGINWTLPGAGLAMAVALTYVAGFLFANALGRRLVRWGQKALLRVPLIGIIYSASQKFVEAFSGQGDTGFKKVVLLEYPQKGNWALGFLTGLTSAFDGKQCAVVYIPTAPTPQSGWVAIVPIEAVYDTDLSVSTAMQFVFSGGIVTPQSIKTTPLLQNYGQGEKVSN